MFGYEIYYEGNKIREVDEFYLAESEDDARSLAREEMIFIIENEEGYEDCDVDDFDYEIVEVDAEFI